MMAGFDWSKFMMLMGEGVEGAGSAAATGILEADKRKREMEKEKKTEASQTLIDEANRLKLGEAKQTSAMQERATKGLDEYMAGKDLGTIGQIAPGSLGTIGGPQTRFDPYAVTERERFEKVGGTALSPYNAGLANVEQGIKEKEKMNLASKEKSQEDLWKSMEAEKERVAAKELVTLKDDIKDDSGFVLPGFEKLEDVGLTKAEQKKLRDGITDYQSFQKSLADYRKMINEHGTTEIFDREAAGKMDAMAKSLQLKIKNLAQLGVLSFSDIPFIEKQIPAPGIFKTAKGMLGALDATEELMTNSVNNQLRNSGYSPIKKPAAADTTGAAQDSTAQKPDTTRTDSAKVALAKQAINDPEATPEEKAQAQKILSAAGQ